jgi:hypothetical protein
MSYSNVEKIVIAPQIVVYKNIFKFSQELIDLLEEDSPESILDPWRDWYQQGIRKGMRFDSEVDLNSGSDLSIKEKKYLKEIYDITNFINKDYFNDFKENGIWPDFILDWDKLNSIEDKIYIDYFKYENSKQQKLVRPEGKLMMDYHIDELPIPNEIKMRRHVATINFYLNSNYSGGDICVYDDVSKKSYRYKPMVGDAVIMPSTEPFYHGVKKYFDADRYFARTFLDYVSDENIPWKSKYVVYKDDNLDMSESDYVGQDLQIIKINTDEIVVGEEPNNV